jgi:hypothetical protein
MPYLRDTWCFLHKVFSRKMNEQARVIPEGILAKSAKATESLLPKKSK